MISYTLEYDDQFIAEVEITESDKSTQAIKEMVEFWHNYEYRLDENDGNYTRTWLKQLVTHILTRGKPPRDDEGWVKLDGSHDIKLVRWSNYEFDESLIEIY